MIEPRKILFATFLLLAVAGAGVTTYFTLPSRSIVKHATVLPAPSALPEFAMTDHTGKQFLRDDLLGRWHLLFFGFTHCPDICPATLQQLAMARARMAESGYEFPGIILVSVDPERDTVDVMSQYVGPFGAGVTGLTGTLENLTNLTSALGIYFGKSGDPNGNYSVDHTAAVLLIDEAARWRALFSAPHAIDAFVHDLPILMHGR